MKKIYMQPEMKVVKIQHRCRMLVGSDPDAHHQQGNGVQLSRGGFIDDDSEE